MPNVDDIYHSLADVVCQSIEGDWEKAWITARILDDFGEAEYDYQLAGGLATWFDPGLDKNMVVIDSLKELREIMRKDSGEAWSGIVFTLSHDGKFNIELSYIEAADEGS